MHNKQQQWLATHIEVEFHGLRLAESAGEGVGPATPCVVTTLVQNGAVRDVCLAGVRVHVLHLHQSRLRHPTLSLPADCHSVLHCLLQVPVCKHNLILSLFADVERDGKAITRTASQ